MPGFTFYTAKIDELHVVDNEAMTGHTICGQPMVSSNYFENDRFINIDKSRKERRHVCLTCLASMMDKVNVTIHNLQVENDCRASMNERLEAEKAKLQSETQLRKEHPLIIVSDDGKHADALGPIVDKPSEIPGRPVIPMGQRNKDAIYISSGRPGGKTKELIDKVINEVRQVFESGDQNFFVMEILGYDKATVIQNMFNDEGFDTFIVQDFHQQMWNLIIAEKRLPPICVEGEHQEVFEDGPFLDGETIDDIPKCAIPGCKSEEVKYWIHPKDKPCRYFCGDCPESQIEILDKFAESIGEEVGAYDPPLWTVKMLHIHQIDDIHYWLIKAHNMAQAIQRAKEGDFDKEIEEDINIFHGEFIPVDIKKANEEEEKEFDS